MLWNVIKPRLWVAFACLLFAAGAVLHLDVTSLSPERIWGDEGDGFFNTWLLDHTYECLRQGRPGAIPDGRIFAPEVSKTFFWSDNLMINAIPYSLFRLAGATPFESSLWTGYLLAALFFASFCFLFHQCNLLGRRLYAAWPSWSDWCIPFLAYAAFFTPGILGNYFQHIQNLSAFWIYFMIGAMVAHLRESSRWPIWMIAFCLTALLFSSLYYAVIGFALILLWFGFEVMREPRLFMRRIMGMIPLLLPLGVCAGWLALQYVGTPHDERPGSLVKQLSVEFGHVYIPSAGWLHGLLRSRGVVLQGIHHEKPAYPGAGFLLGAVLLIPLAVRGLVPVLRRRKEAWWIALPLLTLVFCVSRKAGMLTLCGAVGVAALGVCILMALKFCAGQSRVHPLLSAVLMLLVMAVVVYGIANGPRSRFINSPANPSIWGLFSILVPGVSKMRAVGRLAVIGQGLLVAAAFPMVMHYAAGSRIAACRVRTALLFAAVLQFADVMPLRAYSRNYSPDRITPTAAEHEFLKTMGGTALVLPAKTFHRNTDAMLFLNPYLDIRQMNGYSSRSTPLWDEIMRAGATHGDGCPQQIGIARDAGADWLIVFKAHIHRHWLGELYASGIPTVFDGPRLLVLRLRD